MRVLIRAAMAALAVMAAILAAPPEHALSAQSGPGKPAPAARVKLTDLGSLDDLKGAFNNDRGQIRIVLLLSPT